VREQVHPDELENLMHGSILFYYKTELKGNHTYVAYT